MIKLINSMLVSLGLVFVFCGASYAAESSMDDGLKCMYRVQKLKGFMEEKHFFDYTNTNRTLPSRKIIIEIYEEATELHLPESYIVQLFQLNAPVNPDKMSYEDKVTISNDLMKQLDALDKYFKKKSGKSCYHNKR